MRPASTVACSGVAMPTVCATYFMRGLGGSYSAGVGPVYGSPRASSEWMTSMDGTSHSR